MKTRDGLRVAELARKVGVSPDAVRYYERVGLLPVPPRTSSGYRRYPTSAIDRVRFIQGCQRFGLRLSEIGDLLAVRDTGVCPCEPAGALLRRRISEVDAELDRLTAVRRELTSMADALPSQSCPDPEPGTWRPETVPKGGD